MFVNSFLVVTTQSETSKMKRDIAIKTNRCLTEVAEGNEYKRIPFYPCWKRSQTY